MKREQYIRNTTTKNEFSDKTTIATGVCKRRQRRRQRNAECSRRRGGKTTQTRLFANNVNMNYMIIIFYLKNATTKIRGITRLRFRVGSGVNRSQRAKQLCVQLALNVRVRASNARD